MASTTAHTPRRIHWVRRVAAASFVVLVGFVGWTGFKLWNSWSSVEREPAITDEVREAVRNEAPIGTDPTDTVNPASKGSPIDDDIVESFLVIGSGFEGRLADVIMLLIFPEDAQPAIVSLPRDLYLPSPCGGKNTRLNANFNGCGDSATGPQLLSLAVEDFTGIPVDHFAIFDFEGFEEIIDDVGGVTICVDNPVRDADAWLSLPAGCTEATGAQALAWARTRKTQELVDGVWRSVPGQSDLTRHQHQQDIIFQLFERLQDFSSLGDLTNKVDSLSETFTVDSGLGLGSALRLAWSLRGYDPSEFLRLTIPVESYTTAGGASVLKPTAPFSDVLAAAYPDGTLASDLVNAGS